MAPAHRMVDIYKQLPNSPDIIFKGDDRIESYLEDTMLRGNPDAVLRARDEKDIHEALIFCNRNKLPITFCASQTSMTGSSVAMEGLLVSTARLEGLIDINKFHGKPCAVFRPGTIVADVQKAVADAGFYYPVAPTSRDECCIGSNVATNATGEDSFKYGPIRHYVRKIRVLLADGSEKILARAPDENPSDILNRAGYYTEWKNPLDLFIGSEGTLGFIAEVMLDILPSSMEYFSALIPFSSSKNALEFLVQQVSSKNSGLRTLEFIDKGALAAMKTYEGIAKFPEGTDALIYFKQEYKTQKEREEALDSWYKRVISFSSQKFADGIIIADTYKQKDSFRLWRHRVPEWANEEGHKYWSVGGGKVGGDWWVPPNRLLEMMNFFYTEAETLGFPYMAYAHLGRGHPHTNIFTKNPADKNRAQEMLIRCCKKAVSLGGGVAGEHGIGKIHRDLMSIQYSDEVIEKMKKWKKEYDPNWIIGRGNLF